MATITATSINGKTAKCVVEVVANTTSMTYGEKEMEMMFYLVDIIKTAILFGESTVYCSVDKDLLATSNILASMGHLSPYLGNGIIMVL